MERSCAVSVLLAALLLMLVMLTGCDKEPATDESAIAAGPQGSAAELEANADQQGEETSQASAAVDEDPKSTDPPQPKQPDPPYLTLGAHPLPPREEINITAGNMMWAYYELTEEAVEGAFLVMVPEGLTGNAEANIEAAQEMVYLGGERVGETGNHLGNPGFKLAEVGYWVYRIFLSEEDEKCFLESEGFTVVPADWQKGDPLPARQPGSVVP